MDICVLANAHTRLIGKQKNSLDDHNKVFDETIDKICILVDHYIYFAVSVQLLIPIIINITLIYSQQRPLNDKWIYLISLGIQNPLA